MLTVREKSCQNSAKCLKFDNPILPNLKSLAEILPNLKRLMALGKILPTLKRLRYILINSANSETFEPKILPSLKRLRLILPSLKRLRLILPSLKRLSEKSCQL